MSTVTRKLIAKELYVHRRLLAGAAVAAVAAMAIAPLGRTGFNVGALTWLTTIIAVGLMLAIYGVANERKERSLELVLSLPLAPRDYVRAKLLGLTSCFLGPWLVASAAALLLVIGSDQVPSGMAPFTVLLCGYLLTNFALVLAGALHARSEAAMTALVIATNMGVTLFLFLVGGIDGIRRHLDGPVAVWTPEFWIVLAAELAVLAIALTLPLVFAARRRDFV